MGEARFDVEKFINTAQVGGIEQYQIDGGAGRGVRALCVNTGGGLRYRVLADRGMDIDQAFFNEHSLAFLTFNGATAPSRALDRGIEWLKGFPGGLLTSCGPFNIGGPCEDAGEQVGLHGTHSNSPATIESVVQPDPRHGNDEMRIVGRVRYGKLFNPCVELRRTITSRLGSNAIDVEDEFFNAGNMPVPHAWLLHINLGYPLADSGAEFCYNARVEPLAVGLAPKRFKDAAQYKKVPAPSETWNGSNEAVAYLYPEPADKSGRTTVGLVNRKLGIGVAIRYSTKEFTRCVNWQHWGKQEYVTALEPSNGSVEGRAKDRKDGVLDQLKPGERKHYRYQIQVAVGREQIERLRSLNR
ncbi:MAG TPA: DUF4432 family protein [Tepidisphaeraceae bacterium]|nr:DUF4432 family protein [Tepidisphaeraceae bacterium]